MKILDLMKKYCEHLFVADEPEAMAMYQALLPAVIRCETSVGDTIECSAEDLVKEVMNFMYKELEMVEVVPSNVNIGSVIENTIEFVIETVLAQRKE